MAETDVSAPMYTQTKLHYGEIWVRIYLDRNHVYINAVDLACCYGKKPQWSHKFIKAMDVPVLNLLPTNLTEV